MRFFKRAHDKYSTSGRFVSEQQHRENIARQTSMLTDTLAKLREYGVTDETQLQLEFLFYTDTHTKALALASRLEDLKYRVDHGKLSTRRRSYFVSGWTDTIRMSIQNLEQWCCKMCDFGFECDCDFDGWGTSLDQ